MKLKHPTLTIVATLVLLGGPLIQPVQAGISISIGTGHHYGYNSYNYKRRHYYQRSYSRRHYYQRSYSRKYDDHAYGYQTRKRQGYSQHNSYRKNLDRYDCHAVTKWAYDNYGRKLKIGGTRCSDAYGRAYLVPGSRYVIHQY